MKIITRILLVIVIIILPFVTVITSIRIALTPAFISVEYRLPGFPPDEFGFTTEDRLIWAQYSINYLLGRISDEELANTFLPDGTPLYNQRELSHMKDVRDLTQQVLKVWVILLIILGASVILALATGMGKELLISLKHGALLTIILILTILFYLAVNFDQLFTQFHQIFFEGDSWLFYLSDNLIRLFPIRFWRDIFIFIGGLSGIISIVIFLITKKYSAPRRS